MKRSRNDPETLDTFTDVELSPPAFAGSRLILMAFLGAPQASAFRDWWGLHGAAQFGAWLKANDCQPQLAGGIPGVTPKPEGIA